MSRWQNDQDDWADDPDDWATEDDSDNGGFDEDEADDDSTVPCSHCGADVYEDAERCPRCGNYLSGEDAPPARKPRWFILGAIVSLYVVYRWIVG